MQRRMLPMCLRYTRWENPGRALRTSAKIVRARARELSGIHSFKAVELRSVSIDYLVADQGIHVAEHRGDELLRIGPKSIRMREVGRPQHVVVAYGLQNRQSGFLRLKRRVALPMPIFRRPQR